MTPKQIRDARRVEEVKYQVALAIWTRLDKAEQDVGWEDIDGTSQVWDLVYSVTALAPQRRERLAEAEKEAANDPEIDVEDDRRLINAIFDCAEGIREEDLRGLRVLGKREEMFYADLGQEVAELVQAEDVKGLCEMGNAALAVYDAAIEMREALDAGLKNVPKDDREEAEAAIREVMTTRGRDLVSEIAPDVAAMVKKLEARLKKVPTDDRDEAETTVLAVVGSRAQRAIGEIALIADRWRVELAGAEDADERDSLSERLDSLVFEEG
jgi:hypothetical protein